MVVVRRLINVVQTEFKQLEIFEFILLNNTIYY